MKKDKAEEDEEEEGNQWEAHPEEKNQGDTGNTEEMK